MEVTFVVCVVWRFCCLRPFIIAEDRRFVEVIEIADEKLHVVSANKEYFDKTVEGFKNITFVTCTTDGGSSQPININVHWIYEMTFETKRKLIQVKVSKSLLEANLYISFAVCRQLQIHS